MDRQFTVVVEKPKNEGYFFRNFDSSTKSIEFISSLAQELKVHKIFAMDKDGRVDKLTVGFFQGRLDLVLD